MHLQRRGHPAPPAPPGTRRRSRGGRRAAAPFRRGARRRVPGHRPRAVVHRRARIRDRQQAHHSHRGPQAVHLRVPRGGSAELSSGQGRSGCAHAGGEPAQRQAAGRGRVGAVRGPQPRRRVGDGGPGRRGGGHPPSDAARRVAPLAPTRCHRGGHRCGPRRDGAQPRVAGVVHPPRGPPGPLLGHRHPGATGGPGQGAAERAGNCGHSRGPDRQPVGVGSARRPRLGGARHGHGGPGPGHHPPRRAHGFDRLGARRPPGSGLAGAGACLDAGAHPRAALRRGGNLPGVDPPEDGRAAGRTDPRRAGRREGPGRPRARGRASGRQRRLHAERCPRGAGGTGDGRRVGGRHPGGLGRRVGAGDDHPCGQGVGVSHRAPARDRRRQGRPDQALHGHPRGAAAPLRGGHPCA